MVQWNVGKYPAQIWGFLDLMGLPRGTSVALSNGAGAVGQGVWAVIESCNYVPAIKGERPSDIFKRIILDTTTLDAEGNPVERKFYLVDVATFVAPLIVIPNVGSKCEYLMMTPKAQWAEDFKRWMLAPHSLEVEEMKEEDSD
jgi:hypothetical protein